MPLKMSIPAGEKIHLPGDTTLYMLRRNEFVAEGDFRFIRDKDYVYPEEVYSLGQQFRYALQEHYLNDDPFRYVADTGKELAASFMEAGLLVRKTMSRLNNFGHYHAIIYASQRLGY